MLEPGPGAAIPRRANDGPEIVSTSLTSRPVPARGLQDKRALITGGSRGIGAAIARRFASEGAHVALTYATRRDSALATLDAVRAFGGQALALEADSQRIDTLLAAVERTVAELGGIDILVHSAGVATFGHVADYRLEDLDRALAVNLRGTFVTTQAAVRHMPSGGRVIMIGSCNADRTPFPGNSVYAMTKAGLVGLVKGLARDLAPRGITVNNVQPGPIDTDMNPADSEFADLVRAQVLAIKRYGTADEVAGMVAYVAGPEAGYLTGASLMIDGGFTA
ncbi:MAG: 3-oxoacyl-ACP reductase family protein [Gammaproteobacteria bacterium]